MSLGPRIAAAAVVVSLAWGCRSDEVADTPPPVVAEPAEDPLEPWSDAWLDAEADHFLGDRAFRREMLERSLTNHDNQYSRARLTAYALPSGGWDVLPVWVPKTTRVDAAVVEALSSTEPLSLPDTARPIWDGQRPQTQAQWVALGETVFFEYPLRPEVFAEHALAHPDVATAVGLEPGPDGLWPGVVAFEDLDGRARIGITCALCHVDIQPGSAVVGRARRDLDYGQMRLRYHADTDTPLPEHLAARMAKWGPGRADITQDDDEDPVAIPDLWGVRSQSALTQAGTIRHVHPAALAIRQETQILHANRERTRPPRELAWALAMYVYSLTPPPREASEPMGTGKKVFTEHCRSCHDNPAHGGDPLPAKKIGTDPTLAFGRARGTGKYRPSPLVRVADAAPYLHQGTVPTLEDLLSADRFEPTYDRGVRGPGPIAGHRYGTDLSPADHAALLDYLRAL